MAGVLGDVTKTLCGRRISEIEDAIQTRDRFVGGDAISDDDHGVVLAALAKQTEMTAELNVRFNLLIGMMLVTDDCAKLAPGMVPEPELHDYLKALVLDLPCAKVPVNFVAYTQKRMTAAVQRVSSRSAMTQNNMYERQKTMLERLFMDVVLFARPTMWMHVFLLLRAEDVVACLRTALSQESTLYRRRDEKKLGIHSLKLVLTTPVVAALRGASHTLFTELGRQAAGTLLGKVRIPSGTSLLPVREVTASILPDVEQDLVDIGIHLAMDEGLSAGFRGYRALWAERLKECYAALPAALSEADRKVIAEMTAPTFPHAFHKNELAKFIAESDKRSTVLQTPPGQFFRDWFVFFIRVMVRMTAMFSTHEHEIISSERTMSSVTSVRTYSKLKTYFSNGIPLLKIKENDSAHRVMERMFAELTRSMREFTMDRPIDIQLTAVIERTIARRHRDVPVGVVSLRGGERAPRRRIIHPLDVFLHLSDQTALDTLRGTDDTHRTEGIESFTEAHAFDPRLERLLVAPLGDRLSKDAVLYHRQLVSTFKWLLECEDAIRNARTMPMSSHRLTLAADHVSLQNNIDIIVAETKLDLPYLDEALLTEYKALPLTNRYPAQQVLTAIAASGEALLRVLSDPLIADCQKHVSFITRVVQSRTRRAQNRGVAEPSSYVPRDKQATDTLQRDLRSRTHQMTHVPTTKMTTAELRDLGQRHRTQLERAGTPLMPADDPITFLTRVRPEQAMVMTLDYLLDVDSAPDFPEGGFKDETCAVLELINEGLVPNSVTTAEYNSSMERPIRGVFRGSTRTYGYNNVIGTMHVMTIFDHIGAYDSTSIKTLPAFVPTSAGNQKPIPAEWVCAAVNPDHTDSVEPYSHPLDQPQAQRAYYAARGMLGDQRFSGILTGPTDTAFFRITEGWMPHGSPVSMFNKTYLKGGARLSDAGVTHFVLYQMLTRVNQNIRLGLPNNIVMPTIRVMEEHPDFPGAMAKGNAYHFVTAEPDAVALQMALLMANKLRNYLGLLENRRSQTFRYRVQDYPTLNGVAFHETIEEVCNADVLQLAPLRMLIRRNNRCVAPVPSAEVVRAAFYPHAVSDLAITNIISIATDHRDSMESMFANRVIGSADDKLQYELTNQLTANNIMRAMVEMWPHGDCRAMFFQPLVAAEIDQELIVQFPFIHCSDAQRQTVQRIVELVQIGPYTDVVVCTPERTNGHIVYPVKVPESHSLFICSGVRRYCRVEFEYSVLDRHEQDQSAALTKLTSSMMIQLRTTDFTNDERVPNNLASDYHLLAYLANTTHIDRTSTIFGNVRAVDPDLARHADAASKRHRFANLMGQLPRCDRVVVVDFEPPPEDVRPCGCLKSVLDHVYTCKTVAAQLVSMIRPDLITELMFMTIGASLSSDPEVFQPSELNVFMNKLATACAANPPYIWTNAVRERMLSDPLMQGKDIRSIMHMAENHNPKGMMRWQNNAVVEYFRAVHNRHAKMAQPIIKMMGLLMYRSFIGVSSDTSKTGRSLLVYKDGGYGTEMKAQETPHGVFQTRMKPIMDKLIAEDEAEAMLELAALPAKLAQTDMRLRTQINKKTVLLIDALNGLIDDPRLGLNSQLANELYVPRFSQLRDANYRMFRCTNGVLLTLPSKPPIFTQASPQDYLTMSSRTFYKEYTLDHDDVQWMLNYLRKLFNDYTLPVAEQDDYMIHQIGDIARCLVGRQKEKKLRIWRGRKGDNGKTTYVSLIMATFGDYADNFKTEIFTADNSNPQGANQELVCLDRKRVVFGNELDERDVFRGGPVKKYTGGDRLAVRANYGAQFSMQATFRPIIHANMIPGVKNGGETALRRFEISDFDSVFTHGAPRNEKQQRAERHYPIVPNLEEMLNEKASAFLWLMVYYYPGEDIYTIPPSMARAKTAFLMEVDHIAAFVKKEMVRQDRNILAIGPVFDRYKTFMASRAGNLTLNMDQFIGELISHKLTVLQNTGGSDAVMNYKLIDRDEVGVGSANVYDQGDERAPKRIRVDPTQPKGENKRKAEGSPDDEVTLRRTKRRNSPPPEQESDHEEEVFDER